MGLEGQGQNVTGVRLLEAFTKGKSRIGVWSRILPGARFLPVTGREPWRCPQVSLEAGLGPGRPLLDGDSTAPGRGCGDPSLRSVRP